MTNATDQQAYGDPRWSNQQQWRPFMGPMGGPGPFAGGPEHFLRWVYAAKPVLIVLMILGFIFWWPVGLLLLGLVIASRHMMYGGACGRKGWQRGGAGPWQGWKHWGGGSGGADASSSSGNRAFDEYRAETLRRLEDEQKDFTDFLDRLRAAKDKAEFDQFMSERRNRPSEPPPQPSAQS